MAVDVSISAELRDFLTLMSRMFTPAEGAEIIMDAARYAGEEAVSLLQAEYPPPPPGDDAPSPLRTPKQIRWWWAMMSRIARNEGEVPDSLRGWKASYKRIRGRKTLVIDPKSGYIRTGTLIRSLSYDVRSDGMSVDVTVGPGLARTGAETGIADYSTYVIGTPEQGQARIHQDRWKPLADVIVDGADDIMLAFEDALREEVLRRVRGM